MKTNRNRPPIDPMREGHPEPFSEPRTIPTGWDLSEMLPKQISPTAKTYFNPILLLTQSEDLVQDSDL
ncbi:MAG TPA: hypothetical protein VF326_07870 [Anaerolineaceae bacterium]